MYDRDYIQDGIDRGLADVEAGRVKRIDEVTKDVPNWAEDEQGSNYFEYPDGEAANLVAQVMDANRDLAYDGSNEPPTRVLTARERDILCRIIGEILAHASRNQPVLTTEPIPHWHWPPVPITIGEGDFFRILYVIRAVINPREED